MSSCLHEKNVDLSLDILEAKRLFPVIEDMEPLLKALADKNRLKIISVLAKKEHCVCELMEIVGLPQNLISHHLTALKKNELVTCRREGKWIYYVMSDESKQRLKSILQIIR